MSETPNTLAGLSPAAKRKLLAELLRDKASAPVPLSYGQRALWYLHRLEPDSAFYNVGWAWQIHGVVDPSALERAFQALVDRHRVLRSTFAELEGQPVARVAEGARVDFEAIAAGACGDEELRARASAEANRPFDLEQGPVMRVRLYTRAADPVLLVVFHHIVYDLWSMMT
jgi:hypothetical protein